MTVTVNKPLVSVLVALASAAVWAQVPAPQQARDAQAQAQAPATGLIAGTVIAGGNGQPVDGATVILSGMELRVTRSALTDDSGVFSFPALPAGTYTLRASKTGHVNATFGQKAPGRAGTPIVLAQGQQLKDLSLEVPKGGVISGAIYDDKNRPSVSTAVRVMRWTMQSGERALVAAGTANTDDRGIYRVFGLTPGEYIVSATARNSATTLINAQITSTGQVIMPQVNMPMREASAAGPVLGYAAVYFPGTTQPGMARVVAVGASEEQLGVDFQLQRVPLSRVTGLTLAPAGVAVTNVQLRLIDRLAAGPGTPQMAARSTREGTFTFPAVPPGQYQLVATLSVAVPRPAGAGGLSSGSTARRLWAQADVQVDAGYAPSITLSLQDGMTVSGALAFDGAAPLPPQLNRVRLTLAPHGQAMTSRGLSAITAIAEANGRFTFTGVTPGQYRIRASGAPGWTLKTAIADGRDALDYWVEVKPGENVANVSVGFGDTSTDLKGRLQSAFGQPTADYTVIIFPADPRYWVPLARRMRSTRPSTDGAFAFNGLPAGEYRLAAVTDVDAGAWYDPALLQELLPASVSVRLIDGQPVVQDLRVSGQ
ncbi:MAG: carboxypeptidase regulatory-like domain-containing protein [Acidobacteria bacterium]|nr:carboxypeptidase regulatory-like domain-containing protein [Acidobacteriota bacterium]